MIWPIAAASSAASAPTPAPEPARTAPVTVQAKATVRILSGVRISFDSTASGDLPPPRDAEVTTDGKVQQARLIEFE
jgi:hypothetical protein